MQKERAFTLIELMITIALAVIVATVAVPSFRSTIDSSRISTATNDLIVGLSAARSEALSRGRPVSLTTRTASCSQGRQDWQCGWRVVDTGDSSTIRQQDPAEPSVEIANAPGQVVYNPSGMLDGNSDEQFRIFIGSSADPRRERYIEISRTGRVRSCNPERDANCPSP
ncbi:GspH/FimT family pseudopilin [Aquisalimonas lutea]|uniref:GspH/FimT family pseudopilin n=1 Tax=Aquisalimonas lutea TaxID=1327750 RepID=UPI0025B60A1F|nr:GspH/FimT family pseudopilin [Aquisalimonas lutea]MDN3517459.1 GspH/FimT family pseudopilin [Aquisalimonas lutea]